MKHALLVIPAILAVSVFAQYSFADTESAKPFDALWSALAALEERIDSLMLTPGPQGPQGEKGDPGEPGPQGPAGRPGITAYGLVYDGFLQTDSSSPNLELEDVYKPANTEGIYCIRSGVKFGGRRIYLVTLQGNTAGSVSVRNSSFEGCPTEYSPYISTFYANGNPADRNFYFGIF